MGSRLSHRTTDDGRPATAVIPQGDEAVFAFASDDGDIYTVRADGTDLRQLTDGPGVASYPVWSPDGTRIAYHDWHDGADSLVVMDAGGGDRITLATNAQATEDCNALLPACVVAGRVEPHLPDEGWLRGRLRPLHRRGRRLVARRRGSLRRA